jgi:TolA-binding protein
MQQVNSLKIDMNIHKEILASIPEDNKKEIRDTLEKIAKMKEKIEHLKATLRKEDSEGYDLMVKLESATGKFQELSKGKQFKQIFTLEHNGPCAIDLVSGERIDCLVAAVQHSGDWTLITTSGEAREYMKSEVVFG